MLSFLPAFLVGLIAILLYCINLLFWPIVLFLFVIVRLFFPFRSWREWGYQIMNKFIIYWQDCNNVILWLTTKTEWDIQGVDDLAKKGWYLLISNHQSWADILILEHVFHRKIPMLKFFMKKQLMWMLPLAGWGCWLLDFPFMERYSKELLIKHPELKGKDLETTRKACQKFKAIPTAVINFPEGTRFSEEKKQRQDSPYRYLLRPKAGGVAFTLAAMEDCLQYILNVTIVYPTQKADAWDFFCGKLKKISVHVQTIPITKDLLGDYENNREYRIKFQNYLNQLWQEKDQLIADLRENHAK